MKNIINKIFILIFTVSSLLGVSEAGAVWLLINPGAAAQGTGEAQVARASDAYATYYNPAGLAFLNGQNVALQHVNWLPNLTSDIFYDFISFSNSRNGVGFGGHIIYINLGEQTKTNETGQELGTFQSYDICLTGSYGTKLNSSTAVGFNFKIYHQKLAEDTTVGEAGKPYSTDAAFDISYLKKFGKSLQHSFGLLVQNIGPPVAFIDAEQADPAPTNMKFGIYSRLYQDDNNSLHLMFDANKLLVATYTEMDWNGDGKIGNGFTEEQNEECRLNSSQDGCNGWTSPSSDENDEYAHSDEWYQSVYTSWLNDWYYGGDYNKSKPGSFLSAGDIDIGYSDKDAIIGGFVPVPFAFEVPGNQFPGIGIPGGEEIFVPNYDGFCLDSEVDCYFTQTAEDGDQFDYEFVELITEQNDSYLDQWQNGSLSENQNIWIDLPHDGLNTESFCENSDLGEDACIAANQWRYGDTNFGGVSEYDRSTNSYNSSSINQYLVSNSLGTYNSETFIWSENGANAYCDNSWGTQDEKHYLCYLDVAYGGEYSFAENEYGAYNVWGYREKGSGDNRKFSDEFKEMIYNLGLEWWYTDNFVMRLGYIHDDEGEVKQPTFGAGVHFDGYGFDFGYTAGADTDARSNTMFFSLALNL